MTVRQRVAAHVMRRRPGESKMPAVMAGGAAGSTWEPCLRGITTASTCECERPTCSQSGGHHEPYDSPCCAVRRSTHDGRRGQQRRHGDPDGRTSSSAGPTTRWARSATSSPSRTSTAAGTRRRLTPITWTRTRGCVPSPSSAQSTPSLWSGTPAASACGPRTRQSPKRALPTSTRSSTRRWPVSRIGHRVIIRTPLGFCIYECIGCWNFHKGRAKNIRLLWGGGVFSMVPWAKILSDLNLVLTLYYRHCALASIASGGRYHSRSSRRCGRHHSCSS